jgi:hypothetical protein
MLKQQLIDKLLRYPFDFTQNDFEQLVGSPQPDPLNFEDLRHMIKRIFSINENTLLEQSSTSASNLKSANEFSSKSRIKKYYNRILYNRHKIQKVIVAEGDSWFQFPVFVEDIIDHLNHPKNNYAISSIAYAGDWLTNMIYEGKYVEELSIHRPDVFLISGGGNDLVGNNRLAVMVRNPKPKEDNTEEENKDIIHSQQYYTINNCTDTKDKEDIIAGRKFLTKDFFAFILTIKAQYHLMFEGLHKPDIFKDMKIITQGYDYAIPTYKLRNGIPYMNKGFWNLLEYFVNFFVGSGQWLYTPLMIRNITNSTEQEAIVKAMIYEVNEMFIELANNPDFENVYHIDCRGVAQNFDDWFDEIHLKSHQYKRIAKAYQYVIENKIQEKVVVVRNNY